MKLKTISHVVLIIYFLIVIPTEIKSQSHPQSSDEFPLGTWATTGDINEPNQYVAIENTGFNWVVQGVYPTNRQYMQNFNIITQNPFDGEWVYHYSVGKYKKWEAEDTTFAFYRTGIKHPHDNWNQDKRYLYGKAETLNGVLCWATDSTSSFPVDSVLWGPNYSQEKKYRTMNTTYYDKPIKYKVRYRLALKYAPQPTDTICKLYVRYRCAEKQGDQTLRYIEEILDSLYLTAADLPGETFHIKSLNGYIYPQQYREQIISRRMSNPNPTGIYYDDWDTLTGIEYCVKWYGKGKLYIDYVEVFDDDNTSLNIPGIWKQWLENPASVSNRISQFLSLYSDWNNIRYWYVIDEPQFLDDFEPIRIVDSLVYLYSGRRVITQFTPGWNGIWNGDISVQKVTELSGTGHVMMDYFPFWNRRTSEFGFRHLQPVLQQTASYSPHFFYEPQEFGQFYDRNFQQPCHWREPSPKNLMLR